VSTNWKNEMMYLLSEGCKNVEHNSGDFKSVFLETLRIVFRIFGGKEPINTQDQKGIVGEFLTIYELYPQFGKSLIECWSRDALIDFDLEYERNCTIETKCISKSRKALVTVSHFNQLEWKDNSPKAFLAVARCTTSKVPSEFLRLPEFVDFMIAQITDLDLDSVDLFKAAITAQLAVNIFDDEVRKRFVTRFDFETKLEFYEIVSGDSADRMAKQIGIPEGVAIDSYKLEPNVLQHHEF